MRLALKQKGIQKSLRTVQRIMSEMGLTHTKRVPHGITKATTEIQERENLIKRDFSAVEPMKKLLSDITEIQCADKKLYVSAVLDCFNGEIVALTMDDNMKKELCIRTVTELKERYGKLEGTIFHSDRGSQYTSEAFREALHDIGLVQSLSGTGHCYDNARMESFFCNTEERKDLSDCSISTEKRRSENDHLPIRIYLLQPAAGIYCQSQRLSAGSLQKSNAQQEEYSSCCMIYHYFWGFLTALFLTFPGDGAATEHRPLPSLSSESRPEGHPYDGHRTNKPAVRSTKSISLFYIKETTLPL